MFVSSARRRLAVGFGVLMLVVILLGLVWFAVTHTETVEDPGSLIGGSGEAAAPVRA